MSKAKGPKGRANRGYQHGLYTGYAEYRYGSTKPVSVAPIFKKERRESAIQGALTRLRDWRYSPFEHEGTCRAGIRSALCLDGHDWKRSDAEAASLIAESLHRLGAKRPSWDEGQWHYAVPREQCARCGGGIDDADQARGFRYCSDVCARAYRQFLSDQVPWDHELRRMGYWQIVISNAPVLTCKNCEKKFKSYNGNADAVYCSPECQHEGSRTLTEKPCKWCGESFRPKDHTKVYCSMACRDACRVDTWRKVLPEKTCATCMSIFRPGTPLAIYCSDACWKVARNARRRIPELERTALCEACNEEFVRKRADKIYCSSFCSALVSDVRRGKRKAITPPVLDYLFRQQGLRITGERMAA